MALAIIGTVIGLSSFTKRSGSRTKENPVWFEYFPVTENGYLDPDNYIETQMGPTCVSTAGTFCSVFAEPDPTSGDEGERKPEYSSLLSISNEYNGFENYVEGVIHLRD